MSSVSLHDIHDINVSVRLSSHKMDETDSYATPTKYVCTFFFPICFAIALRSTTISRINEMLQDCSYCKNQLINP